MFLEGFDCTWVIAPSKGCSSLCNSVYWVRYVGGGLLLGGRFAKFSELLLVPILIF